MLCKEKAMQWIAIFAMLALGPVLARAEEQPRLKQGPGVATVEAQCGACHSLNYIVMNSPFLGPAQWDAEVAKMINAFGAPIDPPDAKTIGDYLKENYGG
jgi:sulfite dehydrogenase (cytochrome) subunit B